MSTPTTYTLLPEIQTPADLKHLDLQALQELAAEMRQRIIEVTSVNGGHLASNLGVIELTLALHQVFDTPTDKLIWDVSHQTYPHKLLTGRNLRFHTIRKTDGLSGFSCPSESSYDHFYGGHAGAALSTALGVTHTRDSSEENFHVISILGDATFTCGMSFEAMNNLPEKSKKFIVILNDNKMSISKNVGTLPKILSCPSSAAPFFEQYGFTYRGPYAGHDLPALLNAFEEAKDSPAPLLLHVHTNKGQGIEQAQNNPTTYHGVKPFDPGTYKFRTTKNSSPSFPKIFGKHLVAMAEKDPSIVATTPAMPHGSCLTELMEKYPDRCLDVGIAEAHSIAFSGGLAYRNKRKVFASIYSSFLQRALDNVFHDVCLQELPVVFAIDRAGVSGGDGQMCNGLYDIGFLRTMPNMVITQPRNGHLLKELMSSAFSWNRPVAIRYPNLPTEEFEAPIKERELGKGEVLARGEYLLIIALGTLCHTALEVRKNLLEQGISVTVFDPVFIKPLDTQQLSLLAREHEHIVTLEEHSIHCGLGSAVNDFLMSENIRPQRVQNFGVPDQFVPQGSHGELMEALGLSPQKITDAIVKVSSRSRSLAFEA